MLRIGQGYDIHQLVEGRDLILAGVKIPSRLGLLGHSDADIVIHAVIDALLGALALGDIGKMFPDNDIRYKGCNSRKLLEHVQRLINDDYGYMINNLDVTVILESPKLADYIIDMRQNLANDLKINLDCVSIKAKTNEGQDACGRLDAAVAHAVVLLVK